MIKKLTDKMSKKSSKETEDDSFDLLDFSKVMPWITTAVFLAFFVLVFLVYRSFIVPLFMAAIFYILFRKLYYFILDNSKFSPSLAASITVFTILILIVMPFAIVGINLTLEIKFVIDFFQKQFTTAALTTLYSEHTWIGELTRMSLEEFSQLPSKISPTIQDLAPKIFSAEVLSQGRLIVTDIFRILFNFLLSFVILFFLFRNSEHIKESLFRNLPFPDEIKSQMGQRMIAVFDAVVKGNLLIAVGQGTSVGIYFWIFGLATPILYGIVGVFLGLIPIIGTTVLWIPGALYLYFQGFTIKALIFAVLSMSTYLFLENIAKPLLLDKELNLHPMILFFAFLGGLAEFGIKGLIIGPFAVTIFLSIWQIIKVWNLRNESVQ
ncbi:MAG: AI-2E family transporter [Leptospirales bacterium]